MKLSKVKIKNYRSIKDSGEIVFTDNLFVLAGQNESGKSSVLEALKSYEKIDFDRDTLNFEEEQKGNLIQSISCTYEIKDSEEFIKDLMYELKEELKIKEENFLNVEKIRKIKEFTITVEYDHNSNTATTKLNGGVIGLLKGARLSSVITNTNGGGGEATKVEESIIDIENEKDKIATCFWRTTPKIILFSDFSDLLPDKILISDLENKNEKAKGYEAVRKLEIIMGNKTFLEISKLNNAQKRATTTKNIDAVSVTFTKDWKQKIYGNNDVKISFSIENDDIQGKAVETVFFYIETQDDVPLEPRKRSKGMIWFLSAWLSLKSKENDGKLIVLFDEPGLYLHVKAQKDMQDLFKYLTKKEHQIIYSTHSPSLIDIDKLYNIGLVINTEKDGTLVEGLTTSKINTAFKKDALQPISEAMGLDVDVGVLGEKNVLLEGLSDFYYFKAMSIILNKDKLYKFVPGIGIKNGKIYHLISFCLGYGLDWLLIMDDGKNPQDIKKELRENIFNNNEEDTKQKVHILKDIHGIENIFSCKDLLLIDNSIKCDEQDDKVKKIGNGRKIIFAKTFLQKVNNEKIKKDDISEKTINEWNDIFDWIEKNFV